MNVCAARCVSFPIVSLAILLGLGLSLSPEAQARKPRSPTPEAVPPPPTDPMEAENSVPPPPPPAQPSAASSPARSGNNGNGGNDNGSAQQAPDPNEKSGRFMANLKIGPALCLFASAGCDHQGALLLEIGYSVLPNKNAYVILPLQFQFSPSGAAVIIPLGFQYDIAVPPLPGLYFYPRLSIGYALVLDTVTPGGATSHGGILAPEFGVKYVYRGRFNFGGELFSLPMLFGQTSAGGFFNLYYRLMLSAGVNF